ncbi:serine/threonine-protein kinase [Azorhizobium doebereinerae]|uniref:serine/threonine-protein kinase n=1 Tax=Azorhizobium doebereinerae TaxID=281091 RepID=UPI0009FD119A|nr:serine/threonine-protein kinase [Azorhizobium doebereinerae]
MSRAHVCTDRHLDRDVLVKELQDGVEMRRLSDEIAALASIRSKHVVQLYDVIRDVSGNIVGIVEEYLPGDDLNSIIPLDDLEKFMRIAFAIACGIADIHSAGRIHRDIKPGNMKFDAEGCLKIFDFGLARAASDEAATRGAVGTDGYMAPELCVDDLDEARFTQAIDTYAFAATILKLIRGSLPVSLRRVPPTTDAQADFTLQPLVLPQDVAALFNRCFATYPHQRPAMADVRDLLGAHILRDRHRATMIALGHAYELNASKRGVNITLGQLGTLRLSYDGLHFGIVSASGQVFVNNVQVQVPHRLPGACVITVGGPEYGPKRAHITVDVSHPEVVL